MSKELTAEQQAQLWFEIFQEKHYLVVVYSTSDEQGKIEADAALKILAQKLQGQKFKSIDTYQTTSTQRTLFKQVFFNWVKFTCLVFDDGLKNFFEGEFPQENLIIITESPDPVESGHGLLLLGR